jgi:glycosyltransferase involved in cell wall biosynthesis
MNNSTLKVLWFTDGPSLYSNKTNPNSVGGSWVTSLEQELRKHPIELRVAMKHNGLSFEKFEFEGCIYYKMPNQRKSSKLIRLVRRITGKVEDNEYIVHNCLRVIEDYKPDIIQFWGSEFPYGLVLQHLSVPSVLHIMGNLTVYFQKYYSGFERAEMIKALRFKDFLKWETPLFKTVSFKHSAEREREIFKLCPAFFGRTDWDRRVAKILSPKADYYECHEVMRDEFYTNVWQPKNTSGVFEIISVFRDNIYKGLETIYDTAFQLQQIGFKFNWQIAGLEPGSYTKWVLKKNRSYNLDQLPVSLCGKKSTEELIAMINNAHLFVHPSHIENSSNAVSESMLMGIPVLSTSVGGLQSLVENNKTGFLLQDGDPWAMAGAIIEIRENYDSALAIGKEGRKVALQRHDKDRIAKGVIKAYHTIIEKRKTLSMPI